MKDSRSVRVLVLGCDDTTANFGVRALAAGSAAVVDALWPSCEVEFFDGERAPGSAPERMGWATLVRAYLRRGTPTRRWFAQFDVILDTGSGDSFADIYGLRRLLLLSATRLVASKANPRVVLAPQTIGPFTTRRGRLTAKASLRGVASVMARDTASREYARRVLRIDPILASDVVFAIPRAEVEPREIDVVLNVSGLLWNPNPHVDAHAYRESCRELCEKLLGAGRRITLLAHVVANDTSDDDLPACRELADAFDPALPVVIPEGLDEARAVIASSAVLIGARMHACLNALSLGVPAIPWAYSRKFEPLLSDLGWPSLVDLKKGGAAERTLALLDDFDHGTREDAALVGARAREALVSYSNEIGAIVSSR